MNLSVTTKHKLKFQVYACWNEEGGMGEDSFGDWVDTIEEAVTNLQLARLKSKEQWFIRCDVNTTTTKS